ncbi:cytochrome c biogenesis protein ResB [Nanchangia anserum]|uniref:Cytochrome c biogenesis protein ResB n=1 Tax=Nanchangia anserum TaxID=2692125 RepID=A0A8I0GCB8_9ACTO|nr:cytochrome c biogenesis protein ResB [Nanchangia anserum]MBD3690148.1 cytochrome c biogenesis protein ResB [Nanchangia anserum]QOX82073.1 cytochrome c biogenesis protein ResB [Nanchangia anserum]
MARPRSRSPLARFARSVYAFFYNKKVGVVLILLMAVATLLGTLITQAPDGVLDSPDSRAAFLAEMQGRYGGWTKPLMWLGAFSIYTSPIFLVLSALLALSILACTLHRLPQLWRKTMRPRTRVSARFFTRAQYQGQVPTRESIEASVEATRAALRRKHYRVVDVEGDGPRALYADRFRFGPFGTVAAHAAFIIIIAALVISNLWGIDKTLSIPIGTSQPVGYGTGYSVTATSFTDSYDTQGRPTDYVSHILLRDNHGHTLAEQDVRVNTPLRYDGYKFHQASYGFAALVRLTRDGKELYSGGVTLTSQSNDGLFQFGTLDVPGAAREGEPHTVIIATPASGQHVPDVASGQALVRVLGPNGDDNVLGEEVLDRGTSTTIAGLTVSFDRESAFTGITVRRDPGAIWMWLGSILLVVGMAATFGLRHRRVWVRVVPGAEAADRDGTGRITKARTVIEIASADTADTAFERQFAALVADIDTRLTSARETPASSSIAER